MMEKELNGYLRNGETVRWSGSTAPFPLLGERTREQIIFKWVATAACACALLWVYCRRSDAPSAKFITLVVILAAIVIVTPWLEQRSIMGQKYFITSQRAIFLTRDKSMYYMELGQIDSVKRVSLHGEADTLVLGSAIFEDIRRQLRWRASHPKTNLQSQDGQDRAMGLVFYGIRGADIAEMLLQKPAVAETV
ncbi:MAG: hypothetical protein VB094_08950 [Oscillibacter sp.]|nr:hypothetical protein [Oscillibacter sp.]